MAVESIQAGCRKCNERSTLTEILMTGGRCPHCEEMLAPDYTFLLLDEAQRAERLQRSLIMSLRRLHGLPGHLSLDVQSVLRNAVADVDWEAQLADDRDIIRRHATELRPQARAWRRLPGAQRRQRARPLTAGIRSLAQRLRLHADKLEQHGSAKQRPAAPDHAALHTLADRVDASADAVADDRRLADDIVRDAMAGVDETLGRSAD